MRQFAFLGVVALTAGVLLGTSCSSNNDNDNNSGTGGASPSTGGKTSTGGATSSTTTKATGGATSTSSTKATGGKTGVGGATSTKTGSAAGGSSSAGGKTGVGGVTSVGGKSGVGGSATGGGSSVDPTKAIATKDSYLEAQGYKGNTWVSSDESSGGTSKLTLNPDYMCATGTLAMVPKIEGTSDYDYSTYWGGGIGRNLNQVAGGDAADQEPAPADISDYTSVKVTLDGVKGYSVRLQVEVMADADAGEASATYYCADLTETGGTVKLADMYEGCWSPKTSTSKVFDPATMQATSISIALVTDNKSEHAVDICVTELTFVE